jgi:hypothetical protein
VNPVMDGGADPVPEAAPAGPDAGTAGPAATEDERAGGPTGHPQVDGALARLSSVADQTPEQQVAAYEAVHQALRQTLTTIDG